MGGKCGKCCGGLCPFSLGIAVGLTFFFAVLFWSLWVLHYGVPASMAGEHYFVPDTLSAGFILALLCFLKGFVGGFFVALFYDLCGKCKKCCCKKDGKCCSRCGCSGSECKCSTPGATNKM
jgi:hypothetical protein